MKRYFYLLLIIFSIFLTGCANNLTSKVDAGSELSIIINFATNIDISNNQYVIVFPNTSTQESVAPVDETDDAEFNFDTPDDNIQDFYDYLVADGLFDNTVWEQDPTEYFFSNYYKNWIDYIKNKDGKWRLYNSNTGSFPATGNRDTAIDYYTNFDIAIPAGNQISITIPLSDLTTIYAKNDPITFFVYTVNSDNKLYDWMTYAVVVSNVAGDTPTEPDDLFSHNQDFNDPGAANPSLLNPALDIVNWTVSIK